MTSEELIEKLNEIQKNKCETQTLELKAAASGCPKRLYDTLSSFSNQNDGGIIIFGVDENNDYAECGVYDSQDIQKKINDKLVLYIILDQDESYSNYIAKNWSNINVINDKSNFWHFEVVN